MIPTIALVMFLPAWPSGRDALVRQVRRSLGSLQIGIGAASRSKPGPKLDELQAHGR